MGAIDNPPLLRRHRLTVADYYRMGEAGVFTPDARVELIEGEVIDMAPIGTKHGSIVKRLNALQTAAVGARATTDVGQRFARVDAGGRPARHSHRPRLDPRLKPRASAL